MGKKAQPASPIREKPSYTELAEAFLLLHHSLILLFCPFTLKYISENILNTNPPLPENMIYYIMIRTLGSSISLTFSSV